MVTQSGGPWLAARQAMVMTAYQVQDQPPERAKAILREAALSVTRARPTTSERMKAVVQKVLEYADASLDAGEAVGPSTEKFVDKGYLLSRHIPDVFIYAVDVITQDGYVVNKIGTYQIALAAHENNIPFYVFGTPSAENPTIDSVVIEERNPEEVLYAMESVKGYYPAFDIMLPKLVSEVATSRGVCSPYDLKSYF